MKALLVSFIHLHTSMKQSLFMALLILSATFAHAQSASDIAAELARTPYAGSEVSAPVSPNVVVLTLTDAIDRGLHYNLGLLLSTDATDTARAARLKYLSDLLPQVNGSISGSSHQINLAAFGFTPPAGQPSVVGPFSLVDARATLSMPVLDLKALNHVRASVEDVKAAKSTMQDSREIVVLAVANFYLRVLADSARVDSARAELATAETVYQQSFDLKKAGTVPGIDVLRAQVDREARKQKLLAQQNQFAKDKLALARAIGLPAGQVISLADKMPSNVPAAPLSLDVMIEHALKQRNDYLSLQAALKAAELHRKAAESGALPSLHFDADYGAIGQTPTSSHGTYSATGTIKIPIYQGGKVKSEVLEADAIVRERQSQLKNLGQQIEVEIRNAFLDIDTAQQQLEVARAAVQLANEQLTQAKDRFASGVGTSLELVQSEQAVADANENVINALYASNIAKASLARAAGAAERTIREFLGGQN